MFCSKDGFFSLFGPDITESYLLLHGLSLLIRSHEGPDAREKRPEMPNSKSIIVFSIGSLQHEDMMTGFAIDQVYRETGRPLCISLFSAPDYPMGRSSRGNKAAFIRFSGDSIKYIFQLLMLAID